MLFSADKICLNADIVLVLRKVHATRNTWGRSMILGGHGWTLVILGNPGKTAMILGVPGGTLNDTRFSVTM